MCCPPHVCHAEIRQLDSDRQSLVYNHHHELIAASDTISAVRDYLSTCMRIVFTPSQMKTRAESLDADLDALKTAFSEISRLSAEVSIERPGNLLVRPSIVHDFRPGSP